MKTPKKQIQYTIEGTITNQDNEPIKGLLVRATSQAPKTSEKLLGTPVNTNDKGLYKFIYNDADFRIEGKEKGGANIIIQVFSPDGKLLKKSKTHDNSTQHMIIDMKVDYVSDLVKDKELKVSGTIQMQDSQPARQFFVQAFDKDLRSEQLLGEGIVDKEGNYSISYSTKSIIRAERGSADIFIKVFDPKNRPVGTSNIVFNAPVKVTIDFHIKADDAPPLSEFELIRLSISPLLSDIAITQLDETDENQDISFISGETGYSYSQIQHFVQAHYFEADSKIEAPFWYVLLGISFYQDIVFNNLRQQRQQIIERLTQLDEQGIGKALRIAFLTNKIDSTSQDVIQQWLQLFEDYVADLEVTSKVSFTTKALEEVGIKEKAKQTKFARAYNKHKTFSPELIDELKKGKFKVSEINDLQTTYRLSGFANSNFELVKSIKQTFNVKAPKDIRLLAKKSKKDWIALVTKTHKSQPLQVPLNLEIPKQHVQSFTEVYGQTLYKKFSTAFPTMAFSGGLDRAIKAGSVAGLNYPSKVKKVIDANSEFEFLTTAIDEFAKKDSILSKDDDLKLEFKAVQRVFKLSPDFEVTNTLLKDKLHSAHGIYRMGESQFIKKYGKKQGFSHKKAKTIWRKAESTHAASVTLIAELKATENAGSIAAFKSGKDKILDFPNWNNLFKGGDICECKHCRSVYSPAAYFADILMFLKDRYSNGVSVKETLFTRRADLGYLELNCENANVTLPYIDVVNEVLEDVVADGDNDRELTAFTTIDDSDLDQAKADVMVALNTQGLTIGDNVHLARVGNTDRWLIHSDTITYLLKKKGGANYFAEILRNTKAKANELRANPQYVNPFAYQKLKTAKFPFALPFDLFGEEVKACFDKVKIKRWDLMQKFRGTAAPNNATEGEVAAVYFGISVDAGVPRDEKNIILDPTPANQTFEYWGGTNFPASSSNATLLNNIKNVKTFLQVTRLKYNQLLTLLDLEFINPGSSIQVSHLDPTCDTDQKEIKPLDVEVLDRINRFLRLWRKLGWKMWEVGLVIQHDKIGNGSLNEIFLINLMYLVELKNKLGNKVSIEQVCNLFGNLNTTTRFTELHEKRADAIYQELFLNRKLINPLDEEFEVVAVDSVSNTEKIVSHKSVVQAALRLKETDLNVYLNLSKVSDGNLYIPNGINGDLTLSHLSFLYRHALLAKSLKIKATDWEILLKIHNADVEIFVNPKSACEFVDNINIIQSSEFKPDELNYLLTADLRAKSAFKETATNRFLISLRNSLQTISDEFNPKQYDFLNTTPVHDTENLEKLLTDLLLKNNRNESSIKQILSILSNKTVTKANVQNIPTNFEFPEIITASPINTPGAQDIKIIYIEDGLNSKFVLTGLMTNAKRIALLNHASLVAVTANLDYQVAVQKLYEATQHNLLHLKFFNPKFKAALENTTVDFENNLPKKTAIKISFNAETQKLELDGILSEAEKGLLDALDIDPAYLTAVNNIYSQQSIGVFKPNELWIAPNDLTFSSNNFYQENLVLSIKGKAPNSNSLLNYFKEKGIESTIIQQLSDQLGIAQNMTKKLINDYQVIGMQTIFEHFKNTFGISFGVVNHAEFKDTFDTFYWLHRVSLFINKWELDFDELEWLMTYHSPTQALDFATLPIDNTNIIASLECFLRTEKLLKLNTRFNDEEMSILSIIEKLNNGNYASVIDFTNELEVLTDWNSTDIEDWVNIIDLAYHSDYLLIENWICLSDSMKILEQLNAGTLTVLAYANATMGQSNAQNLKQMLRSKYGAESWLAINTEIQDVLRERKRDALAAYILAQVKPADAPSVKWQNTNDLYAYYLLDVEMSSCMLTSRLVQGSGSIQLFVQRCFMGLEPEVIVKSDGDDGDSAWRWWKWMRKYRVWEANRKVFLYPENWIEPELRPDKSSFFQDLENELLQNEVNQLNVEQAYLNYLDKLNEVAQLDIAGFYHEDDADQTIVHVFGRTANAEPHIYYYRQYDYRRWTPWEKIEVDIVGDYLIPMVINKRLFIYWPEFREEPDDERNSSVPIPDQDASSFNIPFTYKKSQLRLAGSEYRNNKWTPKKISKDYFESYPYSGKFDAASMKFYPVDRSEIDGIVGIKFSGSMYGAFELFGCDGVPVKSLNPLGYYNPVVIPDQSKLQHLNYVESKNRSDYPENDFSLLQIPNSFWNNNRNYLVTLLQQTPNLFKSHFAWHLSYLDKLFQGFPSILSDDRGLGVGSWMPFFYADRKKTFMAFPMLGCSKKEFNERTNNIEISKDCESIMNVANAFLGGNKHSKYYYPEIKSGFREKQTEFETLIRTTIDGIDFTVLTDIQKVDAANYLANLLGENTVTTITIEGLKEMIVRFFIIMMNIYLGMASSLLFNSRKYHFKNFYHPFICDFIKLVYNPTQGIPAVMSRETQMKNSAFKFEESYEPTENVYDRNIAYHYPREIVDFSPDGSYSPYNWELFYHTPLMIANSLSKNQRFEEAMEWYHYIFNPIGVEGTLPDDSNAGTPQKYWITKPFFLTTNEDYNKQRIDTILRMIAGDTTTDNFSSQLKADLESQVKDWRNHPFEPHRIAQYRNVAYQKTVFMKYLDNLIAWGDHLFRQDSMESINEATQLYILSAELLGPRPQTIPPQVIPPMETFNELEEDFDDFSNALIQIENYIPVMPDNSTEGTSIAPIPTLYFCIPQNSKIVGYWDTIADRLYKIRNCMNIEGVVRQLSLFEPEIEPGALVKAIAGGMDIGSALANLNAPLPYYRFNTLLQKANEVCNDVKSLGSALLSALEKKDAEELSLLRQGHEYKLLDALKTVRELQIDEAKKNLDGLKESKELTKIKIKYYSSKEFMNVGEIVASTLSGLSIVSHTAGTIADVLAGVMFLIPDFKLGASGFGGSPHVVVEPPTGKKVGESVSRGANGLYNIATILDKSAGMANTIANYQRRKEDWDFQKEISEQELVQIDEQINSAEIRIKITEKELVNQELQMEQSKEVDDFMKSKYTNKELYQWMMGQISQVFFKSYQLAYDLAKRAERCYRFELGIQDSSFIKFGYWDSLKKGLLSGDKLQYDLRRLESSYLDQNRRELELTKHISLALLDPLALIKLRETGKCFLSLPEEIFDLDYPGHYFRRIKSVSISLPCIAGPYTTISCSLRLLSNHIRIQTGLADGYEHNNEDGIRVNDSRFVQNNIPIKAIATSNAQNDSGVFELNFRDERYLPFEGAGAISSWTIDLFNDAQATDFGKSLRQFNYDTVSDAIIHVRYTAREAGGLLKDGAIDNLKNYYESDDKTSGMKIVNLKHDFPSQWHKLLNTDDPASINQLYFELTSNHFPYRDNGHKLKINEITAIAKCEESGNYIIKITTKGLALDDMIIDKSGVFGDLHHATKDVSGNSPVLDFEEENNWKIEIITPDGQGVKLEKNELKDMYLVLGYEWED